MTSPLDRVRERQRAEELCSAAVRALGADPALHFRRGRLYRGARSYPVSAPHLQVTPTDGFSSLRAAADGFALRRRHSDVAAHVRRRPADEVAAAVFDMLEQFRVESFAPSELPGLAHNLHRWHHRWLAEFRRSGLAETDDGLLFYTVAEVCRSRVTGQPAAEESDALIEATRFALAPVIGADVGGLRRHRGEQAKYAAHALSIAEYVAAAVERAGTARAASGRARSGFSLFSDPTDDSPPPLARAGESRTLAESHAGYRVFTRAYDVEEPGRALARPEALRELRRGLDSRVAAHGANVPRLAGDLRRLLAEPREGGWEGGHEEGLVDGRRLALLVTSPGERRLFRQVRMVPSADCVVSLLVDCSGSMRRHHEFLIPYLDLLLRALDLAGVSSELLGFTTGSWNGGRALRDWFRAGRPPHPGRLNERRHLVFKDADTSWRRARLGIAAMLREEIYREGVDGEAVAWAVQRLQARPEARRVLVVVSDGSPMDAATHRANDEHYLDQQLRGVVEEVEAAGEVGICGLGVGLDLSPYYSTCATLDIHAADGSQAFRVVLELLGGRHRRSGPGLQWTQESASAGRLRAPVLTGALWPNFRRS